MSWTDEAKKQWREGVSDFNATDQAKMYGDVDYWGSAIGTSAKSKRFTSPNGRKWCEVTAEQGQVKRVIWNG